MKNIDLRIIHLSDFHLNSSTLNDWKNHLMEAFISKVQSSSETTPIDFIAFTGDLIDKGGSDFGTIEAAFEVFETEVITPLLVTLNLEKSAFIFIPGNHDIDKNSISEINEIGLKQYFNNQENISKLVSKNLAETSFNNIERVQAFKSFEKRFYGNQFGYSYSPFASTQLVEIRGAKVGVSLLNSAWRCYDNSDKGNILISENQLDYCRTKLSKSNLKIALCHHPLDWVSEAERKTVSAHIMADYDMLLTGHVHEGDSVMLTGYTGSILVNQSPSGLLNARSRDTNFNSGFAILDFHKNKGKSNTKIEYFRYHHDQRKFVLNTLQGNEGVFLFEKNDSTKVNTIEEKVVDFIKEEQFPLFDNHLLSITDEDSGSSIKTEFIVPPIDTGNDYLETNDDTIDLNQIISCDNNQILFGAEESSKTALLFRIARDVCDLYDTIKKIPIYVDFDKIKDHNIEKEIKNFVGCSSSELKALYSTDSVIVLLDNFNLDDPTNKVRNGKIQDYLKKHNLKFIATSKATLSGIIPENFITFCDLPFVKRFIRPLRTKEIKEMIGHWSDETGKSLQERKINKLVESFTSYSLPSNALTVSLFLWSFDNSDRKPINSAVLLEIYIETILEKLSEFNIYRDKFDFKNKVQILGRIAQEMLKHESDLYSVKYSKYVEIIEEYIDSVGFDFNTEKIADYFLQKRIFTKTSGNRVKFSYRCFFQFFVAKRMEDNIEFKTEILEKDNFYKYIKEIDYFTGLVRSDEGLLKDIFAKFKSAYEPINDLVKHIDIDDVFLIRKDSKPVKPKEVEVNKIVENRPTESFIEAVYDKRLSTIVDPQKMMLKSRDMSLEEWLVLLSIVLRNSEGVENVALKKEVYAYLLKSIQSWMILYRNYLIEYLLRYEKLPPSIPDEYNYEYILENIPFHTQLGMNKHLSTFKLSKIINDKITQDYKKKEDVSEIERFLSVFLYSDIEGTGFDKVLNRFIKSSKRNMVRNFTMFKLIGYYYWRTVSGSANEEMYLKLISEIKMRQLSLPAKVRDKVKAIFKEKKKSIIPKK